MVRNKVITLAVWVIAVSSYLISLAAWVAGSYNGPKRTFRLLRWLRGHRFSECWWCGFGIKWTWKFCPECGHDVRDTLLRELEKPIAFD